MTNTQTHTRTGTGIHTGMGTGMQTEKVYPLPGVGETIKFPRDATFKLRFPHHFGQNVDLFHEIMEYRKTWEKSLFTFDEKTLAQAVSPDSNSLLSRPQLPFIPNDQVNIDPIECRPIDQASAFSSLSSTLNVSVSHGDQDSFQSVPVGSRVSLAPLTSRNAHLVNPGGHVTALDWLPQPLSADTGAGGDASSSSSSSSTQFLAVSVIHDPQGLEHQINLQEISYYHGHKEHSPNASLHTAIQLWQYIPQTSDVSLFSSIDTGDFGAVIQLKWLPIHMAASYSDMDLDSGPHSPDLGVLAVLFADGKLHLLRLQRDCPPFSLLSKSSHVYSLEDGQLITAFEFVGSHKNKVLVGSSHGLLVEFILPFHPEAILDPSSMDIPSFLLMVGDSIVNNIMVAEVTPGKSLVSVSCASACSFMFEYENMIACHGVLHSKLLLRPLYNPSFRGFLATPAHDNLNVHYAMSPFDLGNTILKSDAPILAICALERLGHPLALVGGSDGKLSVTNYTRKYLNGAKVKPNLLSILKLWQLSWSENHLHLDADFSVLLPDASLPQVVYPPQILLLALAWNENTTASSVYAAGTPLGMLIIERLDPDA